MKVLNQIEKIILIGITLLYPLFFLTTFTYIFETPKLLILFVSIFSVLIIKIVKSWISKSFEFNSGKYDLAVISVMTVTLLSGIFASLSKVDSFFFPGTASFIILTGIYYFLVNQLTVKDRENIMTAGIISGLLLATMQLGSFLGVYKVIPQLPEFMKVNYFTPFNNPLNTIVFLVALLPILIDKLIKVKDISEKLLMSIISLILLISISTSLYLISPNKDTSPLILSFKDSWSIAIDTVKVSPLFGVGPGNYSQSFTKFRPIDLNMTENWNIVYSQSASTLFTLFTETGLLGLFSLLLLFVMAIKKFEIKKPLFVSLLIIIISLVLIPLDASFLLIMFLMLSLNATISTKKIAFYTNKSATILSTAPIMLLILATAYLFAMAFYGEYLFSKAASKINKGDGLAAYELVNRANIINQYSDRYHLFSASLNLVIAENISKNEEVSDTDKENISNLIQQSIAEGKAAVSSNPGKSSNWEALAGIYQTIIAFAKGSDQFAIQSLNQAISLNPTSPTLRLKLGSIYYSIKDYDSAIEVYKLAILAKPNLANPYYNLAIAYRDNGQKEKAKENLEIVLKLVEPDSNDYQITKNEIEALDKNVNQTNNEVIEEAESLTNPEQSNTLELEPQIDIPLTE